MEFITRLGKFIMTILVQQRPNSYFFMIIFAAYYPLVVFSYVTSIPNCDNETEVEEFLKSNQFKALNTYFSNMSASSIPSNSDESEDELNLSFTVNNVLPVNKSLYLRQSPPKLCKTPTQANFQVTILSLDTINESSMTFTLDIWLSIAWFDGRLRFPNATSDYLRLDASWMSKLWTPDIIFVNARKVRFHNFVIPNHALILMRNTALWYVLKLTLDLTCVLHLELYPHDLQICDMKMETMIHTVRDLILSWDAQYPVLFTTDKKIETPQFSLIRTEAISNCTSIYNSGDYSCISVKFYLKRRLGFHLIHSFLPSTLIVILSWITFWIGPDDTATRFGLGLTCLLTLVTLNIQSQRELPPVSYSKAIDRWMITCALFVSSSIIEFAVVSYIIKRSPFKIQNVFQETLHTKNVKQDHVGVHKNNKIQLVYNIDQICRIFFPVSFIIFNIYYWIKYLK